MISRRRFIEELAAFGGLSLAVSGMEALGFGFASAQTAPPVLSRPRGRVSVLILGAGLAGMTAAHELSKVGYDCTILEARAFAGGRCQTARRGFRHTDLLGNAQVCDFDEGLYVNHGPWRIPYQHRSTLHYTREFAVPLEIFVNHNDAAYVLVDRFGRGPLAGKPVRLGQIDEDMRGYAAEFLAKAVGRGDLDATLSHDDRDRFLAYVIQEGRLSPKDHAYRGSEGRGWITPHGAGVDPGPGKPSIPYALTDILASETWRALWPINEHEMQLTMFQPIGGMDLLARGFERSVGRLIRYSTTVERIAQEETGVEAFFTGRDGQRGSLKADYCICTIPLSVLRGVELSVSDRFKRAMAGVAYVPANKIGLQMKRRFWEEDHFIYGGHVYTDLDGISLISLPSSGWQGRKGVVLGYYEFGGHAARVSAMSPADRAAHALAAGQKIFPQYAENYESAFSFSWHLSRHNLGAWAEWSDESRARDYPLLCEPDGRIYLAGEHLTYLNGWQAGAIESAWQQIAKLHARVGAA